MKNTIHTEDMEESIRTARALVECIEMAANSDLMGCDGTDEAICFTARKAGEVLKHIQNLYFEDLKQRREKSVDVRATV